ncbi:MAG: phytoene/squalene synthase family protein [Chloroflexota bacterium]|nr:phytoene/squalene synthase family protein [Chloroflexota bacterium]
MESDLRHCQEIFRAYSRTYYYSSHFFPARIRENVYALYAFFRTPDEYVDNPVGDPRQAISCFRAEYEQTWATGVSASPVLRSFLATVRMFEIPKEWADAFLDAMAMDLTVSRYETYEDLCGYVYGSAEVVGLMMAKVLGVPPEGLAAARELGRAMQLTNFYRDIGEDWERGRIYVPLEDMERFGIQEREWNARIDPRKFGSLLHYLARRNDAQYRQAHDSLRLIPWQCRMAVALSSVGYQRTLQCIERDPTVVWRTRIAHSRTDYLPILYRAANAAYVH